MKGKHTVAATHHDLELVALLVSGAANLAVVGGLTRVHGRAEESAAHHDIGVGVGAGITGGDSGEALEVDVDLVLS